ncbi:d3dc6fe4-80c6-4b77-b5fb-f9de06e561e2 [Thermothielavioides terrestris]|nr:d3dc6fe4-80c6-4b77-b5fb-f9de06e561e2 [Thermothielavioides terrestris]
MPLVTEGGLDEWEPWTPCDGFGAGHPGPRLSRSPAFCLSTFNLLYAIMKVVSVEMLARRRGQPRGVEAPEAFSSQLRRAIDPNLPFGNFISSPSCGTASVPTPYVARATFLWASALADPHSESLLALLEDTLDQYQRRFGKCGMPPFIVACIGSLANEEYMFGFSEQRRERLKSLVSAYKCGSFDERRTSSVAGTTVVDGLTWPAAHEPVGVGDPAHFPRQSTPTTPFAGLAMPSLNDRLTAPQHQQTQPVRGGYKPICGPGMTGSYQGHFRNPPIAVPQGSNAQIQLGTGAGALSATVPAMHQGHTSPHPLAPPAGFGVSPDYDALLDDLASIECTDAVDADAQFMANLGFAPGCDIAEILRRDFGPV